MSQAVTYLFGNIGKHPGGGSTQRVDTDALEALFAAAPDERWVAFLCEIGEGDDNNELMLAKRLAPKGTRFYCQDAREPFVLSPDWGPAKAQTLWVPHTAVEHWSPTRSVNYLHLPGENITCIGAHPAAGAHGQGERPSWAREPLNLSHDATTSRERQVSDRFHEQGRHVVTFKDANDYSLQLQPGEHKVVHDRTDWGTVRPAAGWVADFKALLEVPFHIDSHDGQRMRGRFVPKGAR